MTHIEDVCPSCGLTNGAHRAGCNTQGTAEERLLLAIYGRDPDNQDNIRELRHHAATCTKDNHTYCFPFIPGREIPNRG